MNDVLIAKLKTLGPFTFVTDVMCVDADFAILILKEVGATRITISHSEKEKLAALSLKTLLFPLTIELVRGGIRALRHRWGKSLFIVHVDELAEDERHLLFEKMQRYASRGDVVLLRRTDECQLLEFSEECLLGRSFLEMKLVA